MSEAVPSASINSAAQKNSGTDLPFEKALAELESIVQKLERGDVALEESITLYERGEALKAHCEALLKSAEMRIEKIIASKGDAPEGAPLKKEPINFE